MSLRVDPATGLFSGRFLDQGVTPPLLRQFGGVLLQKADIGVGFDLDGTQSQDVSLTPK